MVPKSTGRTDDYPFSCRTYASHSANVLDSVTFSFTYVIHFEILCFKRFNQGRLFNLYRASDIIVNVCTISTLIA